MHGDAPTTLSYQQHFDHDRWGNQYHKASANNPAGQQTPIALNSIEDADIDKTSNRFNSNTGTQYDYAGNVLNDPKFRQFSYAYDANNRLIKARANGGGVDGRSVYDALGQRVVSNREIVEAT